MNRIETINEGVSDSGVPAPMATKMIQMNQLNSPYKVVFSRWKDALRMFAQQKNKRRNKQQEIEDEDETATDFQDLSQYNGPVLQTEFGFIPLNETNLASTNFNFWRGDTNFNIEPKHKWAIDHTLGVESVDFYTPLRFRISIGKLFNERDVLERVEKALISTMIKDIPKNPPKTDPYSSLAKQYEFFAVISNNGSKQVFHGKDEGEVSLQIQKYLLDNPDAVVYKSWS